MEELDNRRVRQELGFEMRSLEDMVLSHFNEVREVSNLAPLGK